jgi:hypothetical protein
LRAPGRKVSIQRVVVIALLLASIGAQQSTPAAAGDRHTRTATRAPITQNMFAYYYLWWSKLHWHDRLGSNFPYASAPLPLPASLGVSGCDTVSKFAGNQLTDTPRRLFSQDRRATIEHDVRTAAKAGLRGFIVNWAVPVARTRRSRGFPTTGACRCSSAWCTRSTETASTSSCGSAKASDTILSTSHIAGDLAYLRRLYAHDSAFDRPSKRLPLVWTGSRKYSTTVLKTISQKFRPGST